MPTPPDPTSTAVAGRGRRRMLGQLGDGDTGHRDPAGLAEHDAAAPHERGDVPGHRAARHRTGRAHEAEHLGLRHARLLQQPPERRQDAGRLQRRLRAAPVGGAVDQADRDGGQLAGLGVQHQLAGVGGAALGIPGTSRLSSGCGPRHCPSRPRCGPGRSTAAPGRAPLRTRTGGRARYVPRCRPGPWTTGDRRADRRRSPRRAPPARPARPGRSRCGHSPGQGLEPASHRTKDRRQRHVQTHGHHPSDGGRPSHSRDPGTRPVVLLVPSGRPARGTWGRLAQSRPARRPGAPGTIPPCGGLTD